LLHIIFSGSYDPERADALHASRTFHKNLIDREIQKNLNVTFEQNDIDVAIPQQVQRDSGMAANQSQGPTLRDYIVATARLERWNPPDMNDEEDTQPPHLLPHEQKKQVRHHLLLHSLRQLYLRHHSSSTSEYPRNITLTMRRSQ